MQNLIDLLQSNSPTLRHAAEEILSSVDEPLTTLLLKLLNNSLQDVSWEVRCAALNLYAQYIYTTIDFEFPDASELVRDPIEKVRLAAIDYGRISSVALIDALNDISFQVRLAALEALEERGSLDSSDYFLLADFLISNNCDLSERVYDFLLSSGQRQLLQQYSLLKKED